MGLWDYGIMGLWDSCFKEGHVGRTTLIIVSLLGSIPYGEGLTILYPVLCIPSLVYFLESRIFFLTDNIKNIYLLVICSFSFVHTIK